MAETDRVPPQAIEAEMAVLGSMLIEKEAITKAIDMLAEQDFYRESHRRIFLAVRGLYLENLAADAITVSEKLKKDAVFADIGGAAFLTSLINAVSTAANVEHYAGIVREKAILRQIISTGTDMVATAFNEKAPPEEILDKSESALFAIAQRRTARGFTRIADLVHPTLERLERLHADKRDVPGLRSGFADLDKMTAGFQPADLIIIAARPSMGKTALALNIAEHVAMNEKKAVAVFSLEMSKESLMLRLMCSAARVNSHSTRQGFISTQHWSRLTTVATKLNDAPLYIDDSSNLSVLELRARSRRLATELAVRGQGLALIVVDYIQIMRGAGRSESRQQEIAEISRSLKGLAKELNIPVIALSQLSRKPEEKGREGKPQLSDLRESGAIEQDADVVAFIYRESYYRKDDADNEKTATIIIGKQRNGPTGELTLVFEREYTRFEDMSKAAVS